jgi:hypothetical protein
VTDNELTFDERSLLSQCDSSAICPASLHWDGCAYDAFPDDLTPERNRPEKGQLAYVIGEVLDPEYALYDLEREWASGLATLIREEESGFTMRRAEARIVTSNPKVVRADAATRKRWGWLG